jgi:hypothetical protein
MEFAQRGLRAILFAAWLILLWQVIGLTAEGIRGYLDTRPAHGAPVQAAFTADQLRSPEPGVLLGIYLHEVPAEVRVLDGIENRVRRSFPLISLYQAWGSRPDQQFDPRPLNPILARGAIPVLTWEPWVTDFERAGLPPMPDRQFHNLQAIARGDYDFYIERWARAAHRWGQPLMIRLGHEMNASWYPWGERAFGNTAADYVAMWRHVVGVFRRVGADNVLWVWSPAQRPFGELYPGDEYVDWTGITILNFGTVPPGYRWRSFKELFAPFYARLRAHDRPIMLAEVASAEQGGDKARWISEAMASLKSEFPRVKAFVWFNVVQDLYWPINWSLSSSEGAARAFRKAAEDPYFIAPPR